MILLTTVSGFLKPFAWVLGNIFNGLFELIFLIVGWFTDEPWRVPIVAIAIIVFTIVIRILMLPLTVKQQKFSKLQNMMNPEIQEIQAKYKNNKDNESMMKMNEETKAVYAKYGASPSGGCLTMLIQLPIMFALYRVIYHIPGYVGKLKDVCALAAGKIMAATGWYDTLNTATGSTSFTAESTENSVIDSIFSLSSAKWSAVTEKFTDIAEEATKIQGYNSLFGMNMQESPINALTGDGSVAWYSLANLDWAHYWWVILIPLLAGATQFASSMLMMAKNKQVVGQNQSDTQQSMQQSMKMMNYLMPLISVFFCFTLPSCVGLYWIASSLVQMIIQIVINNKMDHMDIEAMVQKNIEKENEKRAKKGLPPRKYVNSATSYAEQVKIQEARDARKGERDAEIKESTDYYANANTAKPGSLAAKANMVRMFNEKNNQTKKDN